MKSRYFWLIVGPLILSCDIFLLMQVLTDTDHCYCVLLNALDGAAFPSGKDTNDSSSSNKLPLRGDTNFMKMKNNGKKGYVAMKVDLNKLMIEWSGIFWKQSCVSWDLRKKGLNG